MTFFQSRLRATLYPPLPFYILLLKSHLNMMPRQQIITLYVLRLSRSASSGAIAAPSRY